jgi:4-hydroxy-tetrahydrodipicolinate reductase
MRTAHVNRIGIYGSQGRMGLAIVEAMPSLGGVHAGGVDAGEDPSAIARECDVLVDFSAPAALEAHLEAAKAAGTPIMIGTTGLSPRHHEMIDAAAEKIAVLQTGNTSLGIGLLMALVRDAARRLGPDWDIEIVEMHHRDKVDAPSGTALMLGEAAAAGRDTTIGETGVHGRAGLTGARARGTIGFSAVRGGTVVGDHNVVFAGDGERIEIGHYAQDRAIFAVGAVKAALWLASRGPGRYRMDQVLGL